MIKGIPKIASTEPKVLVLATAWFPPMVSGEAHILKNLANYYNPDKLVFLAQNLPGSEEFDSSFKSPVVRLRYYSIGDNLAWRFIRTLEICYFIRKVEPRVILVGNGSNAYLLRNALKLIRRRIPYVILIHGTELLGLKNNIKKLAPYLEASCIIANSEYTKALAVNAGLSNVNIVVIRPGCDPEHFRPGLDVTDLKRKFKLEGKRVLLTVGGLVERKGHDMVIKALKKVQKDILNIHYMIAGTGIYQEDLKKMTYQLGLESFVTFIGYVEDIDLPYFYNLCDCFIMTSREALGTVEGLGMVFIEAAACGKPCIAGRSGGMGEAVVDGVTGETIDSEDVDDIAKSILRLFSNGETAREYGRAGRELVKKEFSWNTYYQRVGGVLKAHGQGVGREASHFR